MGAAQIIYIVWTALGLGIYAAKHGQSKEGERYNFWSGLITMGLMTFLLWQGGFFG